MKFDNIFNIKYGDHFVGIENSEYGKTPVITSQGENNGVCGFFNIKPNYKNVISVSRTGSFCEAFYHDYSCYITNDCMVLTPKVNLSVNQILWFVLLIRQNKYRFTYGRKVTPNRLKEIIILDKVPKYVNTTKLPDQPLSKPLINQKLELNDKKWGKFKIADLFNIEKSNELSGDVELDGTKLISASSFNNGVVGYLPEGKKLFRKNCLTVACNGAVGITFYQDKDFYATADINVLIPKFNLNQYVGLFLSTIIREEKYRFNYGRKWGKNRMMATDIRIPITKQGSPDWQFMENYIKSLSYSKNLESIKTEEENPKLPNSSVG